MKYNKEKEEREKVAQKFFSHERRALHDIMPRSNTPNNDNDDDGDTETVDSIENKHRKHNFREDDIERFVDTTSSRSKTRISRYKFYRSSLIVILLIIIIGCTYAFLKLPEATIEITLAQVPKEIQDVIEASISDDNIPLQVFAETKNMTLSFPASGSKNVSRKAHGIIKVCNAFNSETQALVATTRFSTTNDVLFRLDKSINVPGATVVDGKIQPKCIEAEVTADKAGIQYNIGPVSKWSIPGFKGSPKFEGFYGVSDKTMTGGLVGVTKVPTSADISKAEKESRVRIKEVIDTAFKVAAPSGIITVGGESTSTNFTILKEAAIEETDAGGNFQYFIEARDERVALLEMDIKKLITDKVKVELGPTMELSSSNINLQLIGAKRDMNGAINSASIRVNFKGGFVEHITEEEVKSAAAGKKENELKGFMPTEQKYKAHIALWPFWVKRVPSNKDKITVTIKADELIW